MISAKPSNAANRNVILPASPEVIQEYNIAALKRACKDAGTYFERTL
jgi:hypothetical protein